MHTGICQDPFAPDDLSDEEYAARNGGRKPDQPDEPAAQIDLASLTVAELRGRADELGLKPKSKATKAALVDLIAAAEADQALDDEYAELDELRQALVDQGAEFDPTEPADLLHARLAFAVDPWLETEPEAPVGAPRGEDGESPAEGDGDRQTPADAPKRHRPRLGRSKGKRSTTTKE